jgi:hypothetical protein
VAVAAAVRLEQIMVVLEGTQALLPLLHLVVDLVLVVRAVLVVMVVPVVVVVLVANLMLVVLEHLGKEMLVEQIMVVAHLLVVAAVALEQRGKLAVVQAV